MSEPRSAPPTVHPLIRSVKPVLDALGASFVAVEGMEASDVPLVWEGRTIAGVRMPPLHGALDRLIDAVEAELGGRLPLLSREDKQRAVRLLDAARSSCDARSRTSPTRWVSAASRCTTT
jgi:hypothetical protein